MTDIDLFILASGILGLNPEESTPAETAAQCQVNFSNSVASLQLISERMAKQGHGQILVITSVAGIRPRQGNYVYGATKAGLDFYAIGLSGQLAGTGVTLSVLRPGFVFSKMTLGLKPAPFALNPQQVAKLSIKGLSRRKEIIYAPGLLKYIFFFIRFLPRSIIDRFL